MAGWTTLYWSSVVLSSSETRTTWIVHSNGLELSRSILFAQCLSDLKCVRSALLGSSSFEKSGAAWENESLNASVR